MMSPLYKVLLQDADYGAVSPSVPFTQGVGTIIAYGDMPHGHDAVIIEVSHDNANFVPLHGIPDITAPVAATFTLAHAVYMRARVPEHGGGGFSVTVVLC
jgi:hypothetical protein